MAAVWTRDGRPWRMAHDLTADEIRQTDERNARSRFLPVDVAGYVAAGGDEGKPTDRFAALWVERTGDDDARMVRGVIRCRTHEGSGTTQESRAGSPDAACLAASGWQAELLRGLGKTARNRRHGSTFETSLEGTSSNSPAWSERAVWLPDRPRSHRGTTADQHEERAASALQAAEEAQGEAG